MTVPQNTDRLAALLASPLFAQFDLQPVRIEDGVAIDCLGGRTRLDVLAGMKLPDAARPFQPTLGEALFEWIGVLGAVASAQERFTMIELGAGWGHWLGFAACAMRRTRNLPVQLVGVEAEPTHFRWLQRHMADNGLQATLYNAAIATEDGEAPFYTGSADAWYGQAVAPAGTPPTPGKPWLRRLLHREAQRPMETVSRVKTMSFRRLLASLGSVDVIHSDIQGSEGEVFPSAIDELDAKVGRVVIGTHSAEAEARLRDAFGGHGWQLLYDYGTGTRSETPFGEIEFQDGAQLWDNPRFR
jgi:FkbM family methyltransferase